VVKCVNFADHLSGETTALQVFEPYTFMPMFRSSGRPWLPASHGWSRCGHCRGQCFPARRLERLRL